MVDFRKGLLLLAGMVVTTGLASAQALSPVTCTAVAASTPVVRAEGVAEPVGQVYLDCTGGTTIASGTVPTVNVTVLYSAPVTSRLLVTATSASEALLVIDNPSVSAVVPCAVGSSCSTDVASLPNTYQAVQMSSGLTWNNVAINPPGTSGGHRYIRVVNARVNATSITGAITATILVTSNNTTTSPITVSNTTLNVGYPQVGLTVSAASSTVPTVQQCDTATGSFTVNFKEGFSTAFRTKSPASGDPSTWFIADFTSESTVSSTLGSPFAAAGIANTGTRLIATFANIPSNVVLSVTPTLTDGAVTTATLVSGASASGVGGTLVTDLSTPVEPTITNGAAFVVYEVVTSDPNVISTLGLSPTVSYTDGTTPGLGTITATGSYGPTTAGTTVAAPRFAASAATPFNAITVSPCTTSLLFPFVTNADGFDTGIAIANTSSDPTTGTDGGTVAQAGTVTFYYYGPSAPDAQTSGSVAAGSVLSFALSSGISGTAIAGAPGFTGYMIAQCNFRLAHGYAFISDAGAQKLAQGYLALVLPTGTSRNGASTSEALNQ